MIHTSFYRPKVIPVTGTNTVAEIDRLQDLTAATTLNRTKIEEVGRDGTVCWQTGTPTVNVTMRQYEYGAIEFWQKLANTTAADTLINWVDFKTSMIDIAAYKTDDDAVFQGTVWYPKLRTAGFSLNIGDPDANIERNFTLIGEDEIQFQNDNKYLIELVDTSASGTGHQIVIGSGGYADYPAPVLDPDNSGQYFLRGYRYIAATGLSTELVEGTDFQWDNSAQLIHGLTSASGDVFKFWYTAGSYISSEEPFTVNDADTCVIRGDSASLYLETSNYLYRLQSANIDITLDRFDVKEIGNDSIVSRGVRDITSTVTLGRSLEDFTIEELLRNVATTYGKIDVRKFVDDLNFVVKIYEDETKTTFKLGYKLTGLTPTGLDAGISLNEYVQRGVTLEGEAGFVTSVEGSL